jgi:hypothetical protein
MAPIVSAMRWPRRPSPARALPQDVRSRLRLGRHEHVLATSRLDDGAWVVASSVALLVADAGRVVRHAWHEVAEATWEPETRVVAVRWATPGEEPLRLRLGEEPGRVPEVVRERVMSTYVLSQRVPVRGRRGVTVAVRRDAADGTLLVQAVADEGIDPGRPETAEKVAAMSRELAAQVGLRG